MRYINPRFTFLGILTHALSVAYRRGEGLEPPLTWQKFFVGILITLNASKYSFFNQTYKKKFSGGQPLPRPLPHWGGGHPLPIPTLLGANDASTPSVLKSWVRHCSLFTARCTLVQSAVLLSHVVCLSVCPSVCNAVNCDHIGWNSLKIISPLVSIGCSLFATPTWRVCSSGNAPKFGPKVTDPLLIWASETFDRKLRPNYITLHYIEIF